MSQIDGRARPEPADLVERLPPAERVPFLLDLVTELRGFQSDQIAAVMAHGFTATRARIVLALAPGRALSYERLGALACPFDPAREPPSLDLVQVHVCHVRPILARRFPWARIRTLWGMGYQMTREPGHRFPWEPPAPSA